MSEWQPVKLADLISIKHGHAFKGEYFSDAQTGPVLLTPGNFAIGGGFKEGKPKYYLGPVLENFRLEPGDLVVTMTDLSKTGDTLGYPALVPEGLSYLHNQRIGLVILKDMPSKIDKSFLYYAMMTEPYRQHVLAGATGSTVRHTSPSRICDYAFGVPDLAAQRAIVAVLKALDDKLAFNNRTSRTCHDMAQAYSAQAHISASPKALMKIADITMGSSPPGESYNSNSIGMPFYQGTRDFGDRFPSPRVWCTTPVRTAPAGSTLLSVRAPVGQVNTARELCCIGRGIASVRSRLATPSVLFHELAASSDIWRPYESEGTVFGAITKRQLEEIAVPSLDNSSAQRLEMILCPLDAQLASAVDESQALAKLKGVLLPRLMSGEIQVRDGEKLVEDAT